jgi:hypothetical protein
MITLAEHFDIVTWLLSAHRRQPSCQWPLDTCGYNFLSPPARHPRTRLRVNGCFVLERRWLEVGQIKWFEWVVQFPTSEVAGLFCVSPSNLHRTANNAHKNSCPRARYSLIPSIAPRPTIQGPSESRTKTDSWLERSAKGIPKKVTGPVCTFLIILRLPILDRMTDSSVSCGGRKLGHLVTGQVCAVLYQGYSFEPSHPFTLSKLFKKRECVSGGEMTKLDSGEGTCHCYEWSRICKWPEWPD